jgi:hypothetical protein
MCKPVFLVIRGLPQPKVYKYKVTSTSLHDNIYAIEIIYLEERLHVLANILAMGSLV